MSDVHIYTLWQRPAALRNWEWRTVLAHLRRVLNRYMVEDDEGNWVENLPADMQPPHRLHYRISPDGSRVIFEALFDSNYLNIETVDRLAKYIRNALIEANASPPQIGVDEDGNPIYDTAQSYTIAQVQNAMRDMITVWQGEWADSREQASESVRTHPVGWSGVGCVIIAPQDISGIPRPEGYYTRLIDIGDYSLWSAEAEVETLRDLHQTLWAMAPTQTLGVLAVVDVFGESFREFAVRDATGMTPQVMLARRGRISNYLKSLGKDTVVLDAAGNEHEQWVGIVDALGHTPYQLWQAM